MEIILAALIAAVPATLAAWWSRKGKDNSKDIRTLLELHTEQDALNFLVLQDGQRAMGEDIGRIKDKVGLR